MFSRILLLSLPACAWSAYTITDSPQSLAKFKEEYNLKKADLDDAFKILEFNEAIRGSASPSSADESKMWAWYSTVTGPKKVEAQQFLQQVEKDGLVHEQLLSTFVTGLTAVLPAGATPALVKNAATNFKALLGSTLPVEDKLAVNKGTLTAWKQLKVMSAAEKAKAIEIAKLKMFEQWSGSLDKAYKTADLDDYQKMTKCFAETVGTATPGAAGAGTNNWEVYSRMPVDLQTKIQTYMLEKLSARIV